MNTIRHSVAHARNRALRHQPASSDQLLRYVLERPELVAAVRDLPGEVLAGLVEQIGLEDAGEIVALASVEQLAQLFEQDVWRAEQAGGDEAFQLERFGLWLEVLAEAGDDFLAARLAALPRDMLLLALHRAVLVLDLDALAVKLAELGEEAEWTEKALESAGHYEEWEEFRLIVRMSERWDVLWGALLALDRDHHALLRDLIERCAVLDTEFINGNGGLYEVLSAEEMLENDLGAERSDRRAAKGHVAPADARAFLRLAERGGEAASRDAITQAYFRELAAGAVAHAPRSASPPPSRAVQRLTQLVAEAQPQAAAGAASLPSLPATKPRATERKALTRARQELRAGGLFERALSELREREPSVASQRLEELAYVANVWIAGGSHQGRKPRPVEALEFAIAVCDSGLARALAADPRASAAELLARTPSDLLFRRGYAARAGADAQI